MEVEQFCSNPRNQEKLASNEKFFYDVDVIERKRVDPEALDKSPSLYDILRYDSIESVRGNDSKKQGREKWW